MELYFARAPLVNYIGAGLWILAPVVIILVVLSILVRKSRLGTYIAGALLLVGSVPATTMSEISINGCCGAPSTGYEGVGYVIGAAIALVGIGIIIFGNKLVKKKSAK